MIENKEKPNDIEFKPGLIVLFGSGETSPSGQKILNNVLHQIPNAPQVALLETPAGFEPNSAHVIGRVADFLKLRLKNYQPRVTSIPARHRKPPFSTDDPTLVAPLLKADMIFMGPGSPTYAVRQLCDSLTWQYLQARQRLGGIIVLASAATIAMSRYALPVYEIYKVGDDLHWKEGLNFFGTYGLELVFIPHWNNAEGGEVLDTSRCFMGKERFTRLMALLPSNITVVGIDEKTALLIDIDTGTAKVNGLGSVTLLHIGHDHAEYSRYSEESDSDLAQINSQRGGHMHVYQNGETFPLSVIGHFHSAQPESFMPPEVWRRAIQATTHVPVNPLVMPSEDVSKLIEERRIARLNKQWGRADELREQILKRGWVVQDTRDGMKLEPKSDS
jgi:cyanophycinase-like exopeptidase